MNMLARLHYWDIDVTTSHEKTFAYICSAQTGDLDHITNCCTLAVLVQFRSMTGLHSNY